MNSFKLFLCLHFKAWSDEKPRMLRSIITSLMLNHGHERKRVVNQFFSEILVVLSKISPNKYQLHMCDIATNYQWDISTTIKWQYCNLSNSTFSNIASIGPWNIKIATSQLPPEAVSQRSLRERRTKICWKTFIQTFLLLRFKFLVGAAISAWMSLYIMCYTSFYRGDWMYFNLHLG